MSFKLIQEAILSKSGGLAAGLFGFGLFAAGITSSLTAPLASSVTAQSLFAKGAKWKEDNWRYKAVWISVLGFGFIVGISGFKPIPVIILAQAINGFLLPFIVMLLVVLVNDPSLMKPGFLNGVRGNVMVFIIMVLTIFLGLNNLQKLILPVLGLEPVVDFTIIASVLLAASTMVKALRQRKKA